MSPQSLLESIVLIFSIVISLRNDMFELAHRLVGIYKTSNVSGSSDE